MEALEVLAERAVRDYLEIAQARGWKDGKMRKHIYEELGNVGYAQNCLSAAISRMIAKGDLIEHIKDPKPGYSTGITLIRLN